MPDEGVPHTLTKVLTQMKHGFFRAAACVPAVTVADVKSNTAHIIDMIRRAEEAGADLAVFPELCVTGYTCGDLFPTTPCSRPRRKPWRKSPRRPRGCMSPQS